MLYNVINYSNKVIGQVEASDAVEAWSEAGKRFKKILDVRQVEEPRYGEEEEKQHKEAEYYREKGFRIVHVGVGESQEPTNEEIEQELIKLITLVGYKPKYISYLNAPMSMDVQKHEISYNMGDFKDTYCQLFGESDWSKWRWFADRAVKHEIEHDKISKQYDLLGCPKPRGWIQQRARLLMEEYYIENVILVHLPVPAPDVIREKDWEEVREGIFDPIMKNEAVLIQSASLDDIRANFPYPLPDMKELCMRIRTPNDICRFQDEMTELYRKGYKIAEAEG